MRISDWSSDVCSSDLGTPILKAARSLGVDIDSVCGGRGLCGRCQVEIGIGEFAKHGISSRESPVSALNQTEARHKEKRGMAESRRLSCQALLQQAGGGAVPARRSGRRRVGEEGGWTCQFRGVPVHLQKKNKK